MRVRRGDARERWCASRFALAAVCVSGGVLAVSCGFVILARRAMLTASLVPPQRRGSFRVFFPDGVTHGA